MGEFQLISDFFRSVGETADQTGRQQPTLEVGIGDDAAVLAGIASNRLLVSCDTLVESVHFPPKANPELVACRALRVNLSDMAAMGAEPRWFTLALTLPEAEPNWVGAFSRGLHRDATAFGCQLIGGDTTKGPMNIGIQMLGLIPENQTPIRRSGAKAGDWLVVTGTLGDSGAALQFDLNSFHEDAGAEASLPKDYFLQRYWLPTPRVGFAMKASGLVHAACDISDGLLADVGHLCEQSGLSAAIQLDALPLSDAFRQHYPQDEARKALTMGDDYELCMAVADTNMKELSLLAAEQGIRLTTVGQFGLPGDSQQAVRVYGTQGEEMDFQYKGYQHF